MEMPRGRQRRSGGIVGMIRVKTAAERGLGMDRFVRTFDTLRKHQGPQVQKVIDAIQRYLASDDPATMQMIVASKVQPWLLAHATTELGRPGELDEYDRRLLKLLLANNRVEDLANWVANLRNTQGGSDLFPKLLADLAEVGFATEQIDALVFACAHWACEEDGNPSEIGKYLLAMDAARMTQVLNSARNDRHRLHHVLQGLLTLFLSHAPQWAEMLISIGRLTFGEEALCLNLLHWFGDRFEAMAADYFARQADAFQLGMKLVEMKPARYSAELAKRVPAHLASSGGLWEAHWILPHLGAAAVGPFVDLLAGDDGGNLGTVYPDAAKSVLEKIAKYGGEHAKPGLLKVLQKSNSPIVRATALEHLIKLNDPSLRETLEATIEQGMDGDARDAARFAVLAAQFAGGRLRERLWADLTSKSKLRRDAAAEALAAGDTQALDRAAAMLRDKSKEARWGAVLLLGKLKTTEATECLLQSLKREEAEEVRDEMARALRSAGVSLEAIVRQLGPIDLDKVRQQGAKIGGLPVKWLSENDLPPIRGIDGQLLDAPLIAYLLHRQSRQKEPIVDPEAAPLYALLDRRTSGDFALKLLNAFLEADAPKSDAWAMITAGVLGDNRVITTLLTKVRGWAQDFAQKLGEWGVEALAISGSDAALMAVESIATKFKDNPRRKFKLIGEAAQNALELAAKRMGLTMEELADRVVPALGFEPGRPRRIEAGKRVIEATISLDFKLSMKDVATGKRAISIPKTAAPEVVAEFKGLGKLLTEVAKSQAVRLENLMVRQHRWIAQRWRELFLQHPVLFPFAVRLVWGTYDESGVRQTFRALPDRSLTDSGDAPLDLPIDKTSIGIVHPLDLSAKQIEAWQSHLSDYEIEPPFPQMERAIVRVTAEQRACKMYEQLKGAKLNALSFRGKAERSGWTRGPVGDGAMVASYRKQFAALGLDAFVTIDGLPAYADPTAEVTIGSILFLPTDATPREFQSRLMALGDVPAMAFSEAIGDIARICGRLEVGPT